MAENAQTTGTENVDIAELQTQLQAALARATAAEAEAEKQKKQKDNYAKENADYKRKAEAQMSEEEKRAQELQELTERATNAEQKLAELEQRHSGLENGFTTEEIDKLKGSKVDFSVLKEIILARVEEAVKSAKAEANATSTADNLLGNGSANKGDGKSDFQKHQESRQVQSTIVEL